MTRLIDADLIEYTHAIARSLDDGHNWNELCVTADEIQDMPTVDAVPVRHAKWIPKITKIGEIDWPSGMMCSGCGEDALNAEGTDFLTDFCPHCGARMDEVDG